MKTSIDLLSNDLIPLFKELRDKVQNIAVKIKFETVTHITSDSFLKPIYR
jgi:hypothetical protein